MLVSSLICSEMTFKVGKQLYFEFAFHNMNAFIANISTRQQYRSNGHMLVYLICRKEISVTRGIYTPRE